MKKIHRVFALLMAIVMALGLITTAFAEPIIDSGKKASLSIYKYDITKAGNDGAWDAEAYVSTGLHDDAVIDKLSKYAIQGVEFTYLRVADIAMNNELLDGQRHVGVLYGFDGSEPHHHSVRRTYHRPRKERLPFHLQVRHHHCQRGGCVGCGILRFHRPAR